MLGAFEVALIDPTCTSAVDLIDSLKTGEEEWIASGSVGSDDNFISWIVGIAPAPAERPHVLVLGHDGPMAYVILASSEREIEDVIRAIGDALLEQADHNTVRRTRVSVAPS